MASTRGTPTFGHVLSPGRIGPMRLANRVVLPAMDMNLCDEGVITDGEIAHYVARATGGTGLLITGSGAVAFPVGAASHAQPGLSEDRFIDGLGRLADAVHEAGSRLCIQLCHHGKTARVDIAEDRPLLVPSIPVGLMDLSSLRDNTPEELGKLAAATDGKPGTFHEATDDDLLWAIDQFAEAARRVKDAGADAVEIHAAHGYLLSSFLSAADNHRDDRWGGSISNRARLTCEVISAVRSAVGDDLAVLVRMSGREFGGPGSFSLAEACAVAPLLVEAGAHAIHVTGYGRNSFANFTDGPLPDTIGAYREMVAAIKATVDVPVLGVGRITPELAEEMIAGGECDFVSMGRQLLADADLVAKLRAGRRQSIRPCINCYVCVEQNFYDHSPRCAVNPALCDEPAARWTSASPARHVVVVGGGPAGMEAARVAATRGHRVTLLEAGDRLGGTAWFSQVTTPANGPLVDWLVHELSQHGVRVELGRRATPEVLRALHADVVVVATGATRGRPDVPGADLAHVLTGDALRALITGEPSPGQPRWLRAALGGARRMRLSTDPDRIRSLSRRWMPVGARVVVVGGGLVGLELGEFLAARGRSVTVLEEGPALGLPMAAPRRWSAVRHAGNLGVTLVRSATVTSITAEDVRYRVRGEEQRTAADTVIIASEVASGSTLADQLEAHGFEVRVIGDANEVGYLEGAIHSAWDVAVTL
jgi:2,4-dienoyl-CoA reductase-like NADH-dependent reductase (Old Yellow Enzyme family)